MSSSGLIFGLAPDLKPVRIYAVPSQTSPELRHNSILVVCGSVLPSDARTASAILSSDTGRVGFYLIIWDFDQLTLHVKG